MARLLLLLALLCCAGEARAEWHRAESAHFKIQADLPEAELRTLAADLETIDALMRTLSAARKNLAKADILVVEDIESVRRMTGISGFSGGITLNSKMGELIIMSREGGDGYALRRILFHEYAHSFMHRFVGNGFPGWYTEGFATFFQTAEVIAADRVRFGAIPPEVEEAFGGGASVPFAEVMSIDAQRLEGPAPVKLYAQGWLMAHSLFSGGPRSGEIRAYLNAVSSGAAVSKPDTFFAGGIAGFDADMTAYLKALPPPRKGALAPVDLSGIAVRAMRPGETRFVTRRLEDVATEYDGTGRAGRIQATARRYALAKALLDEFPEESELAFYTGRLALACGENAAADALADRLLGADPENPTLMAFKADTLIGVARDNPRGMMPLIARSRELLGRAAALDAENPAVAVAMYRNYSADQGATLATRRYLDRAVQLNPGDTDLLNTALEFAVRNGDYSYAIKLITPFANSPHDNAMRSWAIRTIGQFRRQRR